MKKKEIKDYLKERWQRIKEREIIELRKTPINVRFVQTASLMRFANSFTCQKEKREEDRICHRWKKLRENNL